MTTTFWTNDPSILFNKESIFQIWPLTNMSYEEKLNAITRLVIVLTILGFMVTMSRNIVLVGVVTLLIIFGLYKTQKKKNNQRIIPDKRRV